jgi:hypothetical protein
VRRDLVCAALGLALAAAYYAAADALPRSLLADGVGADGVPKLLAAALAVLSVAIGVRSLLIAAPAAGADDRGGLVRHLRALGIAALAAAFVVLAPYLGYPLALALLALAAARYYGAALGLPVLIYAAGCAAMLWFVFARVLGIAMPAGVFG